MAAPANPRVGPLENAKPIPPTPIMAFPHPKLKWQYCHSHRGHAVRFFTTSTQSLRLFPGRRVIPLPGMNDDVLAPLHPQVNGVEESVSHQRLGPVRDVVLMTQLVGDVLERLLEFFHLERKEGPSARLGGEIL